MTLVATLKQFSSVCAFLLTLVSLGLLCDCDANSDKIIDSYSVTWGHVNKYAATIHEQEVLLGDDGNYNVNTNNTNNKNNINNRNATMIYSYIIYPTEGEQNDYTITAMHAYDATTLETDDGDGLNYKKQIIGNTMANAEILSGGIGYNFTILRFQSNRQTKTIQRLKLVIYGLDL